MWSLQIDMKQFMDDMRKLPQQMHNEIDKVNRESAEAFARKAKANAPRHHIGPHIADTITVERGDPKLCEYIVKIGNGQLPYAAALEFGHMLKGNWIPGARFWTPLKAVYNKRWRRRLKSRIRKLVKGMLP